MAMLAINVIPYNPEWHSHFANIRAELDIALSDFLPKERYDVEHVGSTSVPGLAAKPIIDIDIIVPAENIMEATMALTSHGYTYAYEPSIDRMVFRYNKHKLDSGASTPTEDGSPRRAVYLNKRDGAALLNHLTVRNALRADSKLAQEYGQLKLELAKQKHVDIGAYGALKTETIRKILENSGLSEADLHRIRQRPNRRIDQVINREKKVLAERALVEEARKRERHATVSVNFS